MSEAGLPPGSLVLYRQLQREARTAIDRCADALADQSLYSPMAGPDGRTTLGDVVVSILRGPDHGRIGARLLMLLADAARKGDAVALFTVERIATHHAMEQCVAVLDAEIAGTHDAA